MRDHTKSILSRPSPDSPEIVRRRPGAARAPFLVVPEVPAASSAPEGLRATFLVHLEPDDRAALAALCRRLYLASPGTAAAPRRASVPRELLRAVGRDLRHAAGVLAQVGRGEPDPDTAKKAAALGREVRELGERIAAQVGR